MSALASETTPMPSAFVAFAIAIAALIVFTHRANLRRFALGVEARVDRTRLLPRWRRSV
jgi:acyl phosphate:glycerol-3-phosphate acyltransferase